MIWGIQKMGAIIWKHLKFVYNLMWQHDNITMELFCYCLPCVILNINQEVPEDFLFAEQLQIDTKRSIIYKTVKHILTVNVGETETGCYSGLRESLALSFVSATRCRHYSPYFEQKRTCFSSKFELNRRIKCFFPAMLS